MLLSQVFTHQPSQTQTYTLKTQVSFILQFSGKSFNDKDVYVNCQKHIEIGLNRNTAFIHPYCLALDSISNCLYSFVVNKSGVRKMSATEARPVALYTIVDTELKDTLHQLRRYAPVLRNLNGLCHYVAVSKL